MEISIDYLGIYGQDVNVFNKEEKDIIDIHIIHHDENIDSWRPMEFISIQDNRIKECHINDKFINKYPSLLRVLKYLKKTHGVEIDKL